MEETMNKILDKASALLALYIGVMAMYAGGKVISGQTPKWPVIGWVPIYNFAVGVVTVVITAVLIWKASRFALPAAIATLGGHSIVLVILETVYRDVVAAETIQAVTTRITVWVVVSGWLLIRAWRERRIRLGQKEVMP